MNAIAEVKPRPFAWSYSRLKNFETCAKRYYHLDVAKDVKAGSSEELAWGDAVHKAAADYLGKGLEMPPGMPRLKSWCDRVHVTRSKLEAKLLVEQKLAITEYMKPCAFFDSDVWFRTVIDVLVLSPPVALVVDWKTGKLLEDSVQLALAAAVVFSHYPEIHKIRTEFIWLKEGDDVSSREDFVRADMARLWNVIGPRLYALKLAHRDNTFQPTPNKLCRKWCPVTICKYHGS